MNDAEIIESIANAIKEDTLYKGVSAKLLQVWQEQDGSFNASIEIDPKTVHFYELIDETKLRWLWIGEEPKFWMNPEKVRIIYGTKNE